MQGKGSGVAGANPSERGLNTSEVIDEETHPAERHVGEAREGGGSHVIV
jgi:hypothetical protein